MIRQQKHHHQQQQSEIKSCIDDTNSRTNHKAKKQLYFLEAILM